MFAQMADFDFHDFGRNDNVAPNDFDPEEDDASFIDNSEPVFGSTTGVAGTAVISFMQELLQTAVNDYYNGLARKGQTPALGRDYSKFELINGRLRLKAYPGLTLYRR